jgi:hypothetical protein
MVDMPQFENAPCVLDCPTCYGASTLDLVDEFVEWHDYQACGRIRYKYRNSADGTEYTADYEGEGSIISVQCNAEIIYTPTLLKQAEISFLKGRE